MANNNVRRIYLSGHASTRSVKNRVAVLPGQAMQFTTTGTVLNTVVNLRTVALAEELDQVGQGVNDSIAANQEVRYRIPQPGDHVAVRIKAGTTAIAIGDWIKTNNAGFFEETNTVSEGCCVALEAMTKNSTSSHQLLRVEVR